MPTPSNLAFFGGGRAMKHDKGERSFAIQSISGGFGSPGGRFVSVQPSTAAKKAASKRFALHPSSGSSFTVTIVETTRGSSGKQYKYSASRVKLPVPTRHSYSDKPVTHKVVVKPVKN
jgi:hypothetical protein